MTYRPTKRAVGLACGALVLFAVGTSVQAGWVLAIAALLGGFLIAGVLLPLRALSGVELDRRVPATAVAGEPVTVTLAVTNASRSSRGLIRVSDDFCGRGAAVVTWLRPGEGREFSAQRGEARRGVYDGGVCVLESGVPFGVARRLRRDAVSSPLIVHPKVYDVAQRDWEALSARRAPAVTDDTSSVREYQPGDPLRSIHWRSVARRGHLVVREFDVRHHSGVTVAADAPDDPATADAVASVACSLALAAQKDGSEVHLLSARAGDVHIVTARTRSQVLDWGARLSPGDPPLGAVLEAAQRSRAESIVCVCTPDAVPAERLKRLSAGRTVLLVLIGEQRVHMTLSAEGASVATLSPDQVESWFSAGCPLS